MAVTMFFICLQLIWFSAQSVNAAPSVSTPLAASNDGPLWMEAKPQAITPGMTQGFSVSCSLDNVLSYGHPMDIILFQTSLSGTRQKIVSVSAFQPTECNFQATTTATGICHFEDQRYDLALHWDNPQMEQAGDYECEATIMDNDAGYTTFEKQANVIHRSASVTDVIANIQEEHMILKNQVDLSIEVMLSSSEVLNGHRYHMSTFPYVNIDRAEKVCQLVGGHLAVFENDTELKDAVDFVMSLGYNSFPNFMVGIYDETNTGNWVNKATGEPVSFVRWRSNPYSTVYKCAYLDSFVSWSDWYYGFYSCNNPTDPMRFLCKSEVNFSE